MYKHPKFSLKFVLDWAAFNPCRGGRADGYYVTSSGAGKTVGEVLLSPASIVGVFPALQIR